MHVDSKPARLIGGLTLLALCGCHTYSPYGYGYGSDFGYPPPETYAAPPSGYIPGGTVVPGTVVPNRGGGTIAPGKTNPGGTGAPMSGTGASTGSRNPTFEANRGTGGLLPNEKPVPDPKGTESGFSNDAFGPARAAPSSGTTVPMNKTAPTNGGGPSGAFNPAPSPTVGNAKEASIGFPSGTSPFNNGASAGSATAGPDKIKLTGSNKADEPGEPGRFQQPKSATPIAPAAAPAKGGSSTTIDPPGAPMSNATGAPNPYAYDRERYTWLRGKVDYDEGTRSWQIIYSLNGNDKFGGSLTLADDPKLKKLQNDDVVLVEGKVDESRKGDRGKPVYKIDNLFGPLVPKASLGSTRSARNTVVTSAR
jgi:hypothetical protein